MSVMAGVYKWRINFLGKRWESSGDHRPRTVLQVNDIKRTKWLNIDSSLAYLAAVQYPSVQETADHGVYLYGSQTN